MKKIFSILLAATMLLSMSVTSFAANITGDGQSQEVLVTYGVGQSFTVTIPSNIEIDSDGIYDTSVYATDVMVPHGSTLDVTIQSPNAEGSDWYLVDLADSKNSLNYRIDINGSGDYDVESGDTILSVESGEGEGEVGLTFELFDTPTKAGTYQDTLTFTVSVESAELISFTVNGVTYQAEEDMTWAEFLTSPYNPDYSECACYDEESGKKFTSWQKYGFDSIQVHGSYCEDGECRVTIDMSELYPEGEEDYEVQGDERIIAGAEYSCADQ